MTNRDSRRRCVSSPWCFFTATSQQLNNDGLNGGVQCMGWRRLRLQPHRTFLFLYSLFYSKFFLLDYVNKERTVTSWTTTNRELETWMGLEFPSVFLLPPRDSATTTGGAQRRGRLKTSASSAPPYSPYVFFFYTFFIYSTNSFFNRLREQMNERPPPP